MELHDQTAAAHELVAVIVLDGLSGPQGKSEDQPHAKQIAPAEGITPPAEVHACPTVHSGPCNDPLPLPAYRGDRLALRAPHRRALARFESCPFNVGLTHGVVSHSRPPPSRSSGGFMIPTTPCPPECMWTCRTSTVCLLPRR